MTHRPRYAGQPITDDDDAIAAALEDVSVPTLLVSLVHLTGDPSVIRGALRPAGIYLNEVQGFMSPEDQAAARALALDRITDWRDRGCPLPPPPDPELIHEMMDFLVADHVPDEYVPLLLEELELDGTDQRDPAWVAEVPDAAKAGFPVVVIGAGMSGLLAGIRLGHAGIPYTIVEKNDGVGGTWWENRYPGCRVDVGNHFYCYSFAPDDGWTEFFARQPELQAYFERCMRDFGVTDHIRFGTEVSRARWDEDTDRWRVEVRGPDGAAETLEAAALISAVGQLNRPKLPDIEGIDTFAGEAMHSAQWHEGTDLRGKRVAVIGTGASAFQIVPTIAPETAHLTVFQRSAPWMFPNPHYHDAVGPGVQWALRHLPYYGRWYRFLLFWPACDGGLPAMRVDPDWPHQDRAVSELNDAAREFFTQWMADQVGDRPDLLAKVVPDYVCLGKRTLQDNGSWLGALTRDDVDLVTDPIVRITPTGVVTSSESADGTAIETDHAVDVIVHATGFQANRYLWPMEIVGRNGAVLREQWGDRPTAHLGITVPNFPNLFCLYGPGTNLAHGGSLIFHSECQVRYVMGCLGTLLQQGGGTIECRQEAHDAYNERLQAELDTMVWSHPSIRSSWYRNDEGRIYILSPWRLVDYWSWTRQPDLADFTLTPPTPEQREPAGRWRSAGLDSDGPSGTERQGAAVTESFVEAATLWELVERRAAATPDATLLIDEAGRTLTCQEFRDRAERAAAGFSALGVGHGTRVTWQVPNRFETILASFALARLGAIQNPILHLYRHKEVGYAIRATRAELVLVPGEWNGFDFGAMVQELIADLPDEPKVVDIFAALPDGDPATLPPAPTDGDEVRWVYFTSGTTSDPKGVRHTDRTLITGANGLAVALDMSPDDIGSIAFPFAHIAGPDYFGTMLLAGFGAVLIEAFAPERATATFAANGVTMVGGSTAFYQMYLAEQRKDPGTPIIPTLRKMSGGGAPMPPEIYEEVKRELGVKICHGYGMTECPMICEGSPHDTDEQLANTVGRPVAGLELRAVTADGTVAAPGEDGEIRVKGPMVFRGYTDEAATAEAFDDEGWFRTSDVGHVRPDGHVVLTGRLKDIIIRKGENISAKEVEDLLYAHPKVADVAVIGLPDRERGERVCAVVATAEGQEPLTFDEMVATLKGAGLMTQKIPEQLEVVAELPRNQTLGKILKYQLRDTYAAKPWPT